MKWLRDLFSPEPQPEPHEIAPGIPRPSHVLSRLFAEQMIKDYQKVLWQTYSSFFHDRFVSLESQRKHGRWDPSWETVWVTFRNDKISFVLVGMVYQKLRKDQSPFTGDNLKRCVFKVGNKEVKFNDEEIKYLIAIAEKVRDMKEQFELHRLEHVRQQDAVDAIEIFMKSGVPRTIEHKAVDKQIHTLETGVENVLTPVKERETVVRSKWQRRYNTNDYMFNIGRYDDQS